MYCYYCRCTHDSPRWYPHVEGRRSDIADVCWCRRGYMALFRMEPAGTHIAYWYYCGAEEKVQQGSRITCMQERWDLASLRSCAAMYRKQTDMNECERILFGLMLVYPLYGPTEQMLLAHEVIHLGYDSINGSHVRQAFQRVSASVSTLRYNHLFQLTDSNTGLSVFHNPAKRRLGIQVLHSICADIRGAKAFAAAAAALYQEEGVFRVDRFLALLERRPVGVLHGRLEYGPVHFLRALAWGMGWRFDDSEDAWLVWRRMSSSVSSKLRELGIWEYDAACLVRDDLRRRYALRRYSFGDLIVFTCLM